MNLPDEAIERFWSRVEKSDGCWIWRGTRFSNGYGALSVRPKTLKAHRVMAYLSGHAVEGKVVMHSCDNPPCVNPDHLFVGTPADNSADKVAKGRQSRGPEMHARRDVARGERAGNAKLTDADVLAIREAYRPRHGAAALAARYGIDGSTLHDIVKRKTWRHI